MKHKSEDAIQAECYMWFNNTYKELRGCLFSVPNGGARSALQGKIFKMTGVYAGVADMLFMYKGKTYCLELKNMHGTQSPKQIAWQKKIEENDFNYFIVKSLEEFQFIINSIIKYEN